MKYIVLVIIMLTYTNIFSQDAPSPDEVTYRPPAVAGTFYPNDKDTLKKWINEYLSLGKSSDNNLDINGIVVPHAGYVYSGWIAGLAYKQVEGKHYDAVIIIAPSHRLAFNGASVFNGDAYVTSLGEAMVDKELAKNIASFNKLVRFSADGHGWKADKAEHSLEVQLPFIQTVLPGTKIVPVVMGSQNNETVDALLKAIVFSVKKLNRKVLIVASSDLSHYNEAGIAKTKDQPILRAFYRYDYFKLAVNLFSRNWEACGGGPIVVAMMASEQLGANKAEPVKYSNSAASPYIKADRSSVVGYFSGIMYKDNEYTDILPALNDETQKKLLEIAENTVKNVAKGDDSLYKLSIVPKELSDEYAVFVTLKKDAKLRGCMGHTIAENSLMISVEKSAKLACSKDPRFKPVKAEELNDIKYEITVLSRMKKILNFDEIKLGEDGVLLRLGNNSALFLPQVASEQGWDKKTLLEQLSMKAGLSSDSYMNPKTELFIFKGILIH